MSNLTVDQSLQLAEQLVSFGDEKGALAQCANILAVAPDNDAARRLSGAIQFRTGRVAAYRINLPHRTDRLAECKANETHQGIPERIVTLFPAIADPDSGAIGCGKSHIAVLTDFFLHSQAPYCMVLEDDFDFLRPAYQVMETLDRLEHARARWDVLLLDAIDITLVGEFGLSLLQVLETHCTAGYVVSRAYVPKLLACFTDAVAQMDRFRAVSRTGYEADLEIRKRFAIDISWRHLQRRDCWLMADPPFGHQRPSYSDIEKKQADLTKRGLQRT
jgi:hypothetical protein